jgi:hypothetical protein
MWSVKDMIGFADHLRETIVDASDESPKTVKEFISFVESEVHWYTDYKSIQRRMSE